MSTYLIGDIHGCYDELIALLKKVKFSLEKDVLWLTGDLVSRGPDSLKVLRYLKSLGDRVRLVLGNHDLYLLAAYANKIDCNNSNNYFVSFPKISDDINDILNWLRHQSFLQIDEEKKLVMVHAGIPPQWDLQTTIKCAQYAETILKHDFHFFLRAMCKNTSIVAYDKSNFWSKTLNDTERLYFIINAFTRMRYCFLNGKLNLQPSLSLNRFSSKLKPWFDFSNSITKEYSIVFGHWSSLEGKGTPKGIYALDTGCCWGGKLTCLRWEDNTYFIQPSNVMNKIRENNKKKSTLPF